MLYAEKKRTLVTTACIWKGTCLPVALNLLTSNIVAFPGITTNANVYFRVTLVWQRL